MIIGLLTLLHIIVCLILIIAVLLQSGKGADLAGAFGGQGSQTAFGSRGPATFLTRMTTFAAITFMITALALSIFFTRSSVTGGSRLPEEDSGPAKPAATAPASKAPAPAAPAPAKSEPAAPSKAGDQIPAQNPPKP
jgi:preprotein translocase subunit SecG